MFSLLILGWIIGWPSASAQPPRVVLNTGGPAAQIRQLAFSNDSKRLYAAGFDKVVHSWEVGWDQDATGQPRITLAEPLYWEQARSNRGSIFAMAVHPTSSEMVIGGYSARQQSGDIARFSLANHQVVASLPTPQQRIEAAQQNRIGSEGHRQAVVSLDYSPSGRQLASRDELGGLFLWSLQAGNQVSASQLRQPTSQAARFRPQVLFLDDDQLVYSRRTEGNQVQLVLRSLRTGNEATFTENYGVRVAALARDPNGLFWASADASGTIYLSSTRAAGQRYRLRSTHPRITAMSLVGDQLAVISCESIDGVAGKCVLDLFDTDSRRRLDSVLISDSENSLAVAISPNGKFLTISRESPREIWVFTLMGEGGETINQPLSGNVPVVLQPQVNPTRQLALSADGSSVGFGSSVEQIDSQWNLQTGEIVTGIQPRSDWRFPGSIPNGWKLATAGQPVDQVLLTDPNGRTATIRLDPTYQGNYFSHCFLTRAGNPDDPIGLAIGTEQVNSVFVYQFDRSSGSGGLAQAPKLVRWFRDHTGTVTSLLPGNDARTLFSGSLDNTIKLWSLSELFDDAKPPTGFTNQSFWGCDFRIEGNSVVARDVRPDGIAFARTLRDGDQITRIQGYRQRDNSTIVDAQAATHSAAQILDVLNRVSVLRQNLIYAQPAGGGDEKRFIIRPAWEPTLTAFSNPNGEWAVWHPSGFFNASAAEGGSLFQWMILRGINQTPRLVEGGFLSKEFERPDVIEKLLGGAAIENALAGVEQNDPAQVIASIPEIRILTPEVGQSIATDQPSVISALVDFGAANDAEFDLIATIDGARLAAPEREALGDNQFQYRWQATASGRLNQIEVIAKQRGGALNSLYASTVAYRRGQSNQPVPYQLHVLSLASENYAGPLNNNRSGFGKLEFPIDDVEAIVNKFEEKQVAGLGHYQIKNVRELRDDQITVDAVTSQIRQLNKEMRSSDAPKLLVVYLSGHGTTLEGQYHYVTTSTESADAADLKKGSIPWPVIEQAGVPGSRIVYMIDTCHSGTAVDAKSSIRDPLRSGGIVIAAASGREAAKELTPLQHGCFTFSVLSALDGDADGAGNENASNKPKDGVVHLDELVVYVREFVRQLTAGEQKPTATPSRLTDTLRIPLVTTAGN